jgi:hypothetical protein
MVRRPGRHMGKRQRSPPVGRRWNMQLHLFASFEDKENPLTETAKKIAARLLTGIRESAILWIAKYQERASGTPFRGPFSLPLCSYGIEDGSVGFTPPLVRY